MGWLKRFLGMREAGHAPREYEVKSAQAADLENIRRQPLKTYHSQAFDPLGSARKRIQELVEERLEILAKRRIELVKTDRYGVVDATGWNAELQYFADRVVRPCLTTEQANAVALYGLGKLMTEQVEDRVRIRVEEIEGRVPTEVWDPQKGATPLAGKLKSVKGRTPSIPM